MSKNDESMTPLFIKTVQPTTLLPPNKLVVSKDLAASSDLSTPRGLPRPSISHLFLWTFCSACCIAFQQNFFRILSGGNPGNQNVTGMMVILVLNSTLGGAIMMGTVILANAKRKGIKFTFQPGHWLLVVPAVCGAAQFLILLFVANLQSGSWNARMPSMALILIPIAFVLVGSAIAYFYATCTTLGLRWKLFFAALAFLAFLSAGNYVPGLIQLTSARLNTNSFAPNSLMASGLVLMASITFFGPIFIVICLVVVALIDILVGQKRDWLHRLGVITYVASHAETLFWTIAIWLGPSMRWLYAFVTRAS